jgi:isoleucyl-tRNA synthetase
MNSDTTQDLRIGKEILKQQAEIYRRIRNTLRWLLGSLKGFDEAETVPYAELPELERWVLHRLTELDARMRKAAEDYDWTGVYPELHHFCATDLSAFYFDIRKDALYCDGPASPRRRAARTVLDILHRCLCTWLAPVLVFTAEEAWLARFPSEDGSVHLVDFFFVPEGWKKPELAEKWRRVRELRRTVTWNIEDARKRNEIGSSLQAQLKVYFAIEDLGLLTSDEWAEVCIVSGFESASASAAGLSDPPRVVWDYRPDSQRCDRCWRVLPEVGGSAAHPTLCRRCEAVVEAA